MLKGSAILVDLETEQKIEVVPEYAKTTYRAKIDAHIEQLRSRHAAAGMDYQLLVTDQPLDAALRGYLALQEGAQLMGFLGAMVSRRTGAAGRACVRASAAPPCDRAAPGEFADVF